MLRLRRYPTRAEYWTVEDENRNAGRAGDAHPPLGALTTRLGLAVDQIDGGLPRDSLASACRASSTRRSGPSSSVGRFFAPAGRGIFAVFGAACFLRFPARSSAIRTSGKTIWLGCERGDLIRINMDDAAPVALALQHHMCTS